MLSEIKYILARLQEETKVSISEDVYEDIVLCMEKILDHLFRHSVIKKEVKKTMNRINRIKEMERCLDLSREAVDRLEEAFVAYESAQKDFKKLCDYYGSTLWMEDYEADEMGELPADLKRGVLSEDAVYDLITDNHNLTVRMMKLITQNLENKML